MLMYSQCITVYYYCCHDYPEMHHLITKRLGCQWKQLPQKTLHPFLLLSEDGFIIGNCVTLFINSQSESSSTIDRTVEVEELRNQVSVIT